MVKKTKSNRFKIKYSGRSSDYISPDFAFGCLFSCHYCYMRRHRPSGLTVHTNGIEIANKIVEHADRLPPKKPNQTHPTLYTYDIGCNEDFALHLKYHNWKKIFETVEKSDKAFLTFATKYVNEELLDYNPTRIRIRFSMMPQILAHELEPNTTLISDRIKAINKFVDAGYDVHINFSPVVVYQGWINDYIDLFQEISDNVYNNNSIKAEVIFLTHNEKLHNYNLEHHSLSEQILWVPELQEEKISSYGTKNVRYKYKIKAQYIREFEYYHDIYIPWNTIRYIF